MESPAVTQEMIYCFVTGYTAKLVKRQGWVIRLYRGKCGGFAFDHVLV